MAPLPGWLKGLLWIVAAALLVPLGCVYKARHSNTALPRVHIVQGMDNQLRYKSQQANPAFADGRAMRPPVPGTVARGVRPAGWERVDEDLFRKGIEAGGWAARVPVPLTRSLMDRGRERFGIYCAPCHGLAGMGDGIVAKRADRLQEGLWVPPSNLLDKTVVGRADGHLFNTISNGIRTMPAYGPQIPPEDRWAVVAYVRALQRAGNATIADVPASERAKLR